MADPALDTPFLTTRELFVLKLDDWPSLASRYLALGAAGRQAMLTGTVDRVPLSALHSRPRPGGPSRATSAPSSGSPPRPASAAVYASLASLSRQPGLAPVASILEINNGSLNLDPAPVEHNLVQGRLRTRRRHPQLPGHHPHRPVLRGQRPRGKSIRPDPGNGHGPIARRDQGRLHPGGRLAISPHPGHPLTLSGHALFSRPSA